ncbi:MAG: hypothetical protein K9J37_12190 [Saprospiraceae bacterium]|nr:hypothetical protein [Saprospiraceae bacterium]MCF8250669.1 hypothetical protein [Saprospiraceae bacterium]MCF8280807.1 hypothetical protein [Bacteroidales bacterium]MCF8312521.1 hypothetical protein [Saprospiraceae bacterium]MCF8440799.1 hypothetical protein [Saprospiraceae bacterium]
MSIKTLKAFTDVELDLARDLLSAKIASMLGRKMEEGDWDFVYCNAKKIPSSDWSNLHIDINHKGLGVEHKMLRVTKSGTILGECGTTKMHPAGTRSIRIPDEADPNKAMINILGQYSDLIKERTTSVKVHSEDGNTDMRIGWLLWNESLDEFLYFEEEMIIPTPEDYYATWNVTPARGARKESRSLWIFDKKTDKKKYSVTTTAGAKIQPYFDIPSPKDPNLYHFKVQGVAEGDGLVKVWLTKSTARYLELLLGNLDSESVSKSILEFNGEATKEAGIDFFKGQDIATPIIISDTAYQKLQKMYSPISDEYMLQQFAMDLGATK